MSRDFRQISDVNMFRTSFNLNRLVTGVILPKRHVRIPLWEFLKSTFQARENPEASYHRKRIAGFQSIKTELVPNKTYHWCSCGYAIRQVM